MKTAANAFERVVFATSLVLVVFILGVLVYDALRTETSAPTLRLTLGEVEQQAGHFVVPVQVHNDGDRTAQDVHVEVQLGAGPSGEKGTFTLDWLPRQAQQEGRVTFSHNPSHDSLSARVLGFKVP